MKFLGSDKNPLIKFALLSIAAAFITIGVKTAAYLLTGSVGLLSDALESVVNLAGAMMALAMLRVAAQPADDSHAYGHTKAEYFSSGFEGSLILVAAAGIAIAAIRKLISPTPLEQVGLGLVVSVSASLINLAVALILMRAAKKYNSITLEADGNHLLTDVWTSVGVVAGVALVAITGWLRLDPIIALLVAANIVRTGVSIIRQSVLGLMDSALPLEEQQKVKAVLQPYQAQGIQYHHLRTSRAAAQPFVSLHVQVPGEWTVTRGHSLLGKIKAEICQALPGAFVLTHLEPLEEPAAPEAAASPPAVELEK